MTKLQLAKRNVRLYIFVKIFGKRVFLPLAAIYFMEVAGMSFAEIGLVGALYAGVLLLADIPTGIFADIHGKATSLRLGAFLNICSTLTYVFLPNKTMIFIAIAAEALGYAFLTGAGEALIHDSLEVQHKLSSYSKILSRTQSVSLILNAAILAVVPLTYGVDKRLPFLIGTFAYTFLFIVSSCMKDVATHSVELNRFKNIHTLLRSKGFALFALTFGLIGGLYTAPSDMVNIAFKELGLAPGKIGWVFSAAALLGAFFGAFYHLTKNLHVRSYLFLDVSFMLFPIAMVFARSLPGLIFAILLCLMFWRYRRIYYQEHMLQKFPDVPKATLLSILSNSESVHAIWIPAALGYSVAQTNLSHGFGILFAFSLVASVSFMYAASRFLWPTVRSF